MKSYQEIKGRWVTNNVVDVAVDFFGFGDTRCRSEIAADIESVQRLESPSHHDRICLSVRLRWLKSERRTSSTRFVSLALCLSLFLSS